MTDKLSSTDERSIVPFASVLESLFEMTDLPAVEGRYCPDTQTWQHREWLQFSPVKHNQEM